MPFFNDAVTVPVDVPASRATVTAMRLVNTTAANAYLQFFNRPAAQVVLGTTPPIWVVRLSANEEIVWGLDEGVELGVLPSTGVPAPPARMSVAGTTTPTGAATAAISASLVTK
jgi:hypothetical protein